MRRHITLALFLLLSLGLSLGKAGDLEAFLKQLKLEMNVEKAKAFMDVNKNNKDGKIPLDYAELVFHSTSILRVARKKGE